MNYIGKWRFHSIGVINESGNLTYLNAEEYLNSPMPYIDETDEDAVADEMRERKQITSSLIEICENGKLLMLIPVPKEEYESYLAELESGGEKELRPGMICRDVLLGKKEMESCGLIPVLKVKHLVRLRILGQRL